MDLNLELFENININNISKNTIKSYFSRIINLIKKINIDNFNILMFITNRNQIIDFINDTNDNIPVKITIISSILYLLNYFEKNKNFISDEKLNEARLYYKNQIKIFRDNNNIKIMNEDNEKNEKLNEKWISYIELTDIFNKYYDKYINIIKNKTVVKINDYYDIQNMVIFSFYILIEPVRSYEIATLKYQNFNKNTDNYIDLINNKIVFNQYKTSKFYKQTSINLSDNHKLINLIKLFIPFKQNNQFIGDYLFNSNDNTLLDSSSIMKRLHRIIGKPISSSTIRKIYLSDNYNLDDVKKLNNTAKNMMNSTNVIQKNYIKK
jgi:hypothetical protein